jgi:hypothetical protein
MELYNRGLFEGSELKRKLSTRAQAANGKINENKKSFESEQSFFRTSTRCLISVVAENLLKLLTFLQLS